MTADVRLLMIAVSGLLFGWAHDDPSMLWSTLQGIVGIVFMSRGLLARSTSPQQASGGVLVRSAGS